MYGTVAKKLDTRKKCKKKILERIAYIFFQFFVTKLHTQKKIQKN